MRLRFKQRFFSWLDNYDIYTEDGEVAYTVKGQLAWGHKLKIFDASGSEVGTVQQVVLTFLPKFEMYLGENYMGCIKKELTFFKPKFTIDCKGWQMEGNFFEWDYTILDGSGNTVATVTKEVWNWTDTYALDIVNPADTLQVLMVVLAIDAEKCSRN